MLKKITILFISILIISCATTVQQVEVKEAIKITDKASIKPVAISKVVYKIKRGTPLGTVGAGAFCIPSVSQVKWKGSGQYSITDADLVDVFGEVLEENNWPVVGTTDDLFAGYDTSKAELLIGAQITGMQLSVCAPGSGFYDYRLNGSMNMNVEWQIYNPLRRELIGTVRSKGSANIKAVSDDLLYELQTQSFTVAINNLLSSQEFYEMTEKQSREDKVNFGKFTIKNEKKYFKTLDEIVDYSRKSTVTVRAGQGIGSGFAIGDGGYIVTNHHVVRDATKVIVVTSDGIEIESNVVASDKGRDIALIKLVNNIRLRPLYLESKYSIGEKVYAIGNPLDESLSGTFTSGIVSSDRVMDGFNYIQSDTAINPGNSGGPLLNEEGSVIGISTMGIMNAQGLNFFVPVIDGLDYIDVKIMNDDNLD